MNFNLTIPAVTWEKFESVLEEMGNRRVAWVAYSHNTCKAIAVPEVWIYANGELKIYLLQAGEYLQSDRSAIFPQLPIGEWVKQAIDRAWAVGSLAALEEVEDRLRNLMS